MTRHGGWSLLLHTTELPMLSMLQPCYILLAALVGWANERQQQIIAFQNDQIEAPLKKLT